MARSARTKRGVESHRFAASDSRSGRKISRTTGRSSIPTTTRRSCSCWAPKVSSLPASISAMDIFDPHQRYRWAIENDGGVVPNKYIDVYYSPGVGHLTSQTATIVLPNGHRFNAPTTVAVADARCEPSNRYDRPGYGRALLRRRYGRPVFSRRHRWRTASSRPR